MMPARCIYCGRSPVQWHHWTGRLGSALPYLDPDATVPVCSSCHASEHAGWRAAGIDAVTSPRDARLLRQAWLLGSLADLGRPVLLDPSTLDGMHRVVLRIDAEVAR